MRDDAIDGGWWWSGLSVLVLMRLRKILDQEWSVRQSCDRTRIQGQTLLLLHHGSDLLCDEIDMPGRSIYILWDMRAQTSSLYIFWVLALISVY